MGQVAADLADTVIVTDDNPRSEDPAQIRREVMAGCPGAREVGDRATALAEAIHALGPGDVLALAGKGHEQDQVIATGTLAYDEVAAAQAVLAAMGGARG